MIMTFLIYPSPKGLWPLRLCDLATFVWTDQPESLPFRFEGVKQLNVMSMHFQKKNSCEFSIDQIRIEISAKLWHCLQMRRLTFSKALQCHIFIDIRRHISNIVTRAVNANRLPKPPTRALNCFPKLLCLEYERVWCSALDRSVEFWWIIENT